MTAIWKNDGSGWKLLDRSGFPDEKTLHSLVEEAPQLLPLAGAPQLVVVGREVQLGTGYADLLAIEPTGRLAILEIKLAKNSESRRAVIAQVLTYAAFLDGMDTEVLERTILAKHLSARELASLAAAVEAHDQTGSFNRAEFDQELTASLLEGRFRLVIVLDEAPDELVRLVGYLGKVADKVLIDLVTVSSYRVDGSEIIVPQRVEPEREQQPPEPAGKASTAKGSTSEGAAAFLAAADDGPESAKEGLRRLAAWATNLDRENLVRLTTYSGIARTVMLPRIMRDDAGLVSVSSEAGGQFWLFRSVFERRAPNALARLEAAIAPVPVKQGNTLKDLTDDVLSIVHDGYREAAGLLSEPRSP